jgi:hypothetical protein
MQFSNSLWALSPFETKQIADVVVVGGSASLVHGYVNVRTNVTAMNAVVEVAVNISDGEVP